MPKVSERHLEAKRQEILHAAIACFARDGFHKTTMSDIAVQAGVSDGLAYRYFSNKDEIIGEAIRMATGQGGAALVDAVDADDAAAMLELLLTSSFKRFELPGREVTLRLRFRAWAEALDNKDVRAEVVGRWKHHAAVGSRTLRGAQAEGRMPSDLDTEAIARVMLAIHDGLDLQWSLDPSLDVERCRDVVLRLFGGRSWGVDEAARDSG